MATRTDAGDAFSKVVLQILKIGGQLQTAGDAIAKPAKQSAARWKVMGAIDDDPRSVAEIARIYGMARQSIQRIADVLVSEGLAVWKDNPAHQRAKLIALTALGNKSLRAIQARQCLWADRVGGQFEEKPLKELSGLLQRFSGALEDDPLSR